MEPQNTQTNTPASPPLPPQPLQPPQPLGAGADTPLALPAHTASQNIPVQAEDSDVIEKAWIQRVKQVIASTAGDPYARVEEMSKLRADYMKKRYNKDIKLPGF